MTIEKNGICEICGKESPLNDLQPDMVDGVQTGFIHDKCPNN